MVKRFQFQVFPSSGVPIYRQLIDQILAMISSGKLSQDDFLPSVRETAQELQINPMTVSKAYSQLEQKGILELVRGTGMKIKSIQPSSTKFDDKKNKVMPYFEQALAHCYQLDLTQDEVWNILVPLVDNYRKAKSRKEKS